MFHQAKQFPGNTSIALTSMSLALKGSVASGHSQARAALAQSEALKVPEEWAVNDVGFKVDSSLCSIHEWKT